MAFRMAGQADLTALKVPNALIFGALQSGTHHCIYLTLAVPWPCPLLAPFELQNISTCFQAICPHRRGCSCNPLTASTSTTPSCRHLPVSVTSWPRQRASYFQIFFLSSLFVLGLLLLLRSGGWGWVGWGMIVKLKLNRFIDS